MFFIQLFQFIIGAMLNFRLRAVREASFRVFELYLSVIDVVSIDPIRIISKH